MTSEDMLESLKRLVDVDGLPRVKHSSPQDYFGTVAREDSGNLCRWVGELYLELHRGTYTTHAKVRTCSVLLRLMLNKYKFLEHHYRTHSNYPNGHK